MAVRLRPPPPPTVVEVRHRDTLSLTAGAWGTWLDSNWWQSDRSTSRSNMSVAAVYLIQVSVWTSRKGIDWTCGIRSHERTTYINFLRNRIATRCTSTTNTGLDIAESYEEVGQVKVCHQVIDRPPDCTTEILLINFMTCCSWRKFLHHGVTEFVRLVGRLVLSLSA